jgi:pyrroline-5-carboxylate reductase
MTQTALASIQKMAFIGGGNMASALISGLAARGLDPARMVVADPSPEALLRLAENYGVRHDGNAAAVEHADVVVLAVKPQILKEVTLALAPHLDATAPLVISVAAGISHAALSGWLGGKAVVVRSMPNRPALHGCGATGLFAPATVGAAARRRAEAVLGAVSHTVWVDEESQMDTVTALSGSGPAYFFLFMEALEASARARGLSAEVAHRLTVETAFGAAYMAREATDTLATLREQVTSKGGTTAAALDVLESARLRDIVAEALTAAERRSAELGSQFATP